MALPTLNRTGRRVQPALPDPKSLVRPPSGISRRRFFSWAGWIAVLGSLGLGLLGLIRYMFPRVLFEPPTIFKAGKPEEYLLGAVSTRFKGSQRVFFIREEDGIYALSAICTHLGCTVNWLSSNNKFKCPCHGSGFYKSGINFEGPAPRPLERVKITLGEDGQIVVDKNKTYRYERGQWDDPGAFLRV